MVLQRITQLKLQYLNLVYLREYLNKKVRHVQFHFESEIVRDVLLYLKYYVDNAKIQKTTKKNGRI